MHLFVTMSGFTSFTPPTFLALNFRILHLFISMFLIVIFKAMKAMKALKAAVLFTVCRVSLKLGTTVDP